MERRREGLLWLVPGPVVILLVLVTAWMFKGVAPEPETAGPKRFSAIRAVSLYDRVFGPDAPHPAGSPKSRTVVNALGKELERLGMTPQVQESFQCGHHFTCAGLCNVVARFGPEGSRGVLLVAHYDSVPAGPGGSDNAINVATALEAARWYRDTGPYEKDLLLLFSDAEELGLLGAKAFCEEHAWMRDVEFVVNLEARGTRGPSFLFEISGPALSVVDGFTAQVKRPFTNSVAQAIYDLLPNDTDLSVFRQKGVPGVNFAFLDGVMDYHTPNDDRAHLSPSSIQHQGDNCLAVLRAGLKPDTHPEPAGDAVFFDVFSLFVVAWPLGLTPWMTGVVFLLWVVGVWMMWRRELISRSGLCWGCLAWITALLGSWLLTVAAMWVLNQVGIVPSTLPFPDRPVFGMLNGLAMGLFVVGSIAVWARRRAGFWELWIGAFFWWAILGVGVSFIMEKASYLFLIPVAFSVAGLYVRIWMATKHDRVWPWLACLPLLVMGVLVVPMCWTLYTAMGLGVFSPMLLLSSVFITFFLPFLSRAAPRVRWYVPALALGVGISAFVWGWLTPVYTQSSPQHVNFAYRQLIEENGDLKADWWVQAFGEPLPDEFADQAEFDLDKESVFPIFHPIMDGYRAVSRPIDLPPPDVEIRQEIRKPAENRRVVQVLLTSGRQADALLVAWPSNQKIEGVLLAGKSLSLEEIENGWGGIGCYAGLEAGLQMEVIVSGMDPVSLLVADLSYGLPKTGIKPPVVRPSWMTSFWGGDVTLSVRRFVL